MILFISLIFIQFYIMYSCFECKQGAIKSVALNQGMMKFLRRGKQLYLLW